MKTKYFPSVCLLLAQLMVAINVVGSKYLMAHASMMSVLVIRFSIATVFLYALYCWKGQHRATLRSLSRHEWLLIVAQALTAGGLFNALMLLGLTYTDASVAGMIISVLPAFIAVCAFFILKEHLSVSSMLCITFAVLGLLVINGQNLHLGVHHRFLGDAIIFLALIPEGAYYLLARYYKNRLSLLLLSTLMNGINVLVLVPLLLILGPSQILSIDSKSLAILLVTGLASGLFYIFWYMGSQSIQATRAGLFTAVGPVFIVLIAHEWLGESVSVWQMLGMGFIILSIFASGYKFRSRIKLASE